MTANDRIILLLLSFSSPPKASTVTTEWERAGAGRPLLMQISGDSAEAPGPRGEKCLLFAFDADCEDGDDDCVISPGELAR